ncbi:PTS system glucose-specific EIICBA component [Lachnospiraceae bacterium]|nr:PTS system glucose-specific EIICBA component [Lachnospiraceae bacterium]
MKDKIFGVLQRVGRSFMLPIAILPVAGLLLGVGGSFTNETTLQTYGLMGIMGPGTVLNAILQVMSSAGDIVFGNLPIIFAMGVAIGMAKKEKEVAALSAAIAFFIMHASIGAMIVNHGGAESMLEGATTSVVGITSLQMGVFGGIIVGLGVAALHNRFYKIELPQVLSFFGGTRFVPIVSGLAFTVVGILMFFIWPVIQQGIYAVGGVVLQSGYAGTWLYGLMERALIPFGLHHVFYLPFWQTGLGGTMEVGGQLIEGAQNIFFAQLAEPSVEHFAVSATRFMTGKFPLMIFGLPGAALAMYKSAKPEKKKAAAGLLLSAAMTSMVTGITEPLEFTFLFVAPLLYAIHCVFAGLAYMIMHILDVGVGMTFSGGLIDMFLFGVLQGNGKTNWVWIPVVGIVYFIVYYVLFSFLIAKLDLKTPGRDDNEEVKLYRRSDVDARKQGAAGTADAEEDELSASICRGLGGKKNISDVDCCATRLRCTVHKSELVDDALLKSTGASGVVHKGNGVQVIYGPRVTVIKSNLEDYLEHAPEEEYLPKREAADEQTSDAKERSFLRPVKTEIICSPVSGLADEISKVPDEAFAGRMMGDGAMVIPKEQTVCAPADGEVCFVFDTKHAVGFETADHTALLLHMGIDTVNLGGTGFEVLVKAGDKVKKGDVLMKLDLQFIQANAPSLASPVLCTELSEHQKIRLLKTGDIQAGEPLFAVETYEE